MRSAVFPHVGRLRTTSLQGDQPACIDPAVIPVHPFLSAAQGTPADAPGPCGPAPGEGGALALVSRATRHSGQA